MNGADRRCERGGGGDGREFIVEIIVAVLSQRGIGKSITSDIWMNAQVAVSYTHLDVYKRQAESITEGTLSALNKNVGDYVNVDELSLIHI